jgi:hypothetical protein
MKTKLRPTNLRITCKKIYLPGRIVLLVKIISSISLQWLLISFICTLGFGHYCRLFKEMKSPSVQDMNSATASTISPETHPPFKI